MAAQKFQVIHTQNAHFCIRVNLKIILQRTNIGQSGQRIGERPPLPAPLKPLAALINARHVKQTDRE